MSHHDAAVFPDNFDEGSAWATTVQRLAAEFGRSATERDEQGGTPKAQRDALRASDLLALSIPSQYGGLGQGWRHTLDVVRRFAQVDSSIAHVFAFHHLQLATLRLYTRTPQWQPWLEQTAKKRWFWGNALNPLDTRTVAHQHKDWWEFSGKKSFCSGALDSQMLIASAVDAKSGRLVLAAVPTDRRGITLLHDWNNMGQRQTDSGSALFEKVRIEQGELLLDPGPLSTPRSTLRSLIAQQIFVHLFLGLAQGALLEAREYTLHESRPWHGAGVSSASQDPYVLAHYGDFWVGLEGARLLVERAAQLLDAAWEKGDALDETERGHVATATALAKVATTRVGLEVAAGLFEVTGARATHAGLRLDRFWRNLRTQTLHDPVDYKLRELGEWALNRRAPAPSFYA